MPTIKRIGGYRIMIYTRDNEPPHVHIVYEGSDVVFNLLRRSTYGEEPFRLPKNVRTYLEDHQEKLLRCWDEYHRS